MHGSFSMMFFLILDVLDHPFEVFGTKGDDPITPLPFEGLRLDLVIYG